MAVLVARPSPLGELASVIKHFGHDQGLHRHVPFRVQSAPIVGGVNVLVDTAVYSYARTCVNGHDARGGDLTHTAATAEGKSGSRRGMQSCCHSQGRGGGDANVVGACMHTRWQHRCMACDRSWKACCRSALRCCLGCSSRFEEAPSQTSILRQEFTMMYRRAMTVCLPKCTVEEELVSPRWHPSATHVHCTSALVRERSLPMCGRTQTRGASLLATCDEGKR